MPKLNDEGKLYLSARSNLVSATNFSIVFTGDTHVGSRMPTALSRYKSLLTKARNLNDLDYRIACIIHGGDGTDYGESNLADFKKGTEEALYSNPKPGETLIPLFMNIGNHEYYQITDKDLANANIKNYDKYIGDSNIIQEYSLSKQKVSIIFLNTGYDNSGTFKTYPNHFNNQLTKINSIIKNSNNKFFIDMHIPPSIPGLQENIADESKRHSLNNTWTSQFKTFLNNATIQAKVIGVVTHHRHCVEPVPPIKATYGKIPFFLTAYGGQTDSKCTRHLDMLKLDLAWNGKAWVITPRFITV